MSAGSSSDTSFDIYIYQISDSTTPRRGKPTSSGSRRKHSSREMTRKQRDKAALRLKRRAAEFLAQAGELRKAVAHLSAPEQLISPVVFEYFESLIPRLHSIFKITDHFQTGIKKKSLPSGMAGLDFLLRVVKNLIRQIEAALAVAELESGRCRRRPAYFDIYRLLEQSSRSSQNHYLAGEVGLTVNQWNKPFQVRGKRALWHLALVDVLCRAEELSPRKGIAVKAKMRGTSLLRLTFVPRGALIPSDETDEREQRQKLLGRTAPDGDPSFKITQTIVQMLGGRVTVGKKYRSYIMPLFTIDIPLGIETDNHA